MPLESTCHSNLIMLVTGLRREFSDAVPSCVSILSMHHRPPIDSPNAPPCSPRSSSSLLDIDYPSRPSHGIQTDPINLEDKSTQLCSYASEGSQTDSKRIESTAPKEQKKLHGKHDGLRGLAVLYEEHLKECLEENAQSLEEMCLLYQPDWGEEAGEEELTQSRYGFERNVDGAGVVSLGQSNDTGFQEIGAEMVGRFQWREKCLIGDPLAPQVTSISFNSSGCLLACSYGRPQELGWCTIRAPVVVWPVTSGSLRTKEKETENKDGGDISGGDELILFSTNSCSKGFVSSVSFHPWKPLVLAGGTYAGEIFVWEMEWSGRRDRDSYGGVPGCKEGRKSERKCESNLLLKEQWKSNVGDYCHREPVTGLQWICVDESSTDLYRKGNYVLAAVSGDRLVLVWDYQLGVSVPVFGFSVPSNLGCRSLAFSCPDNSTFAVGSEGGNVLRGVTPLLEKLRALKNVRNDGNVVWGKSGREVLRFLGRQEDTRSFIQSHVEKWCAAQPRPIKQITAETVHKSCPDVRRLYLTCPTVQLERHCGPITSLAFSPFNRKLLLSGSADGTVKLFDVTQSAPLAELSPPVPLSVGGAVSCVCWSSLRESVFAVTVATDPRLFVYDLRRSHQAPVLQIRMENCSGTSFVHFAPGNTR
eukprot:GHVQ01023916.1.p1 GENE.GHVQ01023916.1~~GHVQ01023916.1.p1  ORF type:complete len:645 (-),score=81.84 GHVQ01023916.1:95-2029(-)